MQKPGFVLWRVGLCVIRNRCVYKSGTCENIESGLGTGKFKKYTKPMRSSRTCASRLDVHLGLRPASPSGNRDLCDFFKNITFIFLIVFYHLYNSLSWLILAPESGYSTVGPFICQWTLRSLPVFWGLFFCFGGDFFLAVLSDYFLSSSKVGA